MWKSSKESKPSVEREGRPFAQHFLPNMPIEPQIAGRTGAPKGSAKRLTATHPDESPMVFNQRSVQSRELEKHTLAPKNHKAKVTKRRGMHRSRPSNTEKPPIVRSENEGSPLSEEDLFHLLIDRIRDREESAIAASRVREQMEIEIMKLTEENDALKSQLDLSDKHTQKQTSELKGYESRLAVWKLKFTKFKSFLNELGCDFQNLRGEAIQLKATKKGLLSERDEIANGISEARVKLAETSTSLDQRREQLLKVDGQLDCLRKDLRNAENRVNYLLHQLSDERKRSKLLELYIQDCSRTQTTKLGQIMSHQHEMMNNINTAFNRLGRQHDASIRTIQESLCSDLNECLTSLRAKLEKSSSGEKDVLQCKEIIQSFSSR